ncbi:MAG: response regulator transcription factor [Cyanobium sp.]
MKAGAEAQQVAVPGARLWILDADLPLARILEQRLGELGWRVRGFLSSSALLAALERGRPDLLLLGRPSAEGSAAQLVAALRQGGYRGPVLILAGPEDHRGRVEALEAGADDVLVRPFLMRELVWRIDRLLSRPTSRRSARLEAASGSGYRLGPLWFDPANRLLRAKDGQIHALSRGEALLLQALCQAGGAVLSRDQLAHLSGSRHSGSPHSGSGSRSIDVRLSKLRHRLRRAAPAEAWITSVRGRGYRLAVAAHPDAGPLQERSAG